MGGLASNLGYKVFALAIAAFLWGVAHGSSSVERGFDLPVVLHGIPDDLVVTSESVSEINVRIMGSRAAMRNVPQDLEYVIDASGGKVGVGDYEIDVSRLDLPRRARIVSRSPARVELTFERRGSKVVRVRPDLEGVPAPGFVVGAVEVDPPRVRITGVRSEVLRLQEVVTESIDLTGLAEPTERQVRVSMGGGHVWVDDDREVEVRVEIVPRPQPEDAAEESGA